MCMFFISLASFMCLQIIPILNGMFQLLLIRKLTASTPDRVLYRALNGSFPLRNNKIPRSGVNDFISFQGLCQ